MPARVEGLDATGRNLSVHIRRRQSCAGAVGGSGHRRRTHPRRVLTHQALGCHTRGNYAPSSASRFHWCLCC
eukprot:scaffold222535_cov29-Tisochrysis_lutea.AAC.3